jgi:Cu(I)/Ag(I) efflux system protein CusF
MKRFLIITLVCIAFGGTTTFVYANDAHHPKAEVQKSYAVKGEVIVLDKDAGKVKLKHEAIPELDWPAMTMFFSVADKSQLDNLVVGDQVEFQLVKSSDGVPVITQIKSIK